MRSNPIRATLVAAALITAAPALAQTPAPARAPAAAPGGRVAPATIVIVDIARVVRESSAGRGAQAALDPQVNQLETRVRTFREQFAREEQQLAQQASTLAPDALNQRRRDIAQRAQTANQQVQTTQNQLQAINQSVLEQISRAVGPIVEAVMRERGATIAMRREAAVAVSPAIDVTSDIIRRLDAALPRANTSPPPAPARPAATTPPR